MGITDCKITGIAYVHVDVHRRALQHDLGPATYAVVFVFKRCICNKLLSMLDLVSLCTFFLNNRLLFSVQHLCWSRMSREAGGKG